MLLPWRGWNVAAYRPRPWLQIAYLTADGIGACWLAQPEDPARIIGLITDGDLRRARQSQGAPTWSSLTATDLMTVDRLR